MRARSAVPGHGRRSATSHGVVLNARRPAPSIGNIGWTLDGRLRPLSPHELRRREGAVHVRLKLAVNATQDGGMPQVSASLQPIGIVPARPAASDRVRDHVARRHSSSPYRPSSALASRQRAQPQQRRPRPFSAGEQARIDAAAASPAAIQAVRERFLARTNTTSRIPSAELHCDPNSQRPGAATTPVGLPSAPHGSDAAAPSAEEPVTALRAFLKLQILKAPLPRPHALQGGHEAATPKAKDTARSSATVGESSTGTSSSRSSSSTTSSASSSGSPCGGDGDGSGEEGDSRRHLPTPVAWPNQPGVHTRVQTRRFRPRTAVRPVLPKDVKPVSTRDRRHALPTAVMATPPSMRHRHVVAWKQAPRLHLQQRLAAARRAVTDLERQIAALGPPTKTCW